MRQIKLPTGQSVPVIGQGTWKMGETRADADREREALLAGLDAGMTLIDTAEMYGGGRTEQFLGEVLVGRRNDVFLVSKALPQHGSAKGLMRACEDSLRRLRTDYLDLYLLHWPGSVPLEETVAGMTALQDGGKVRAWGVSNFDTDDMEDLIAAGGTGCVANQILYNLTRRGPDVDLAPWLQAHGMLLMAYSPVEQGRLPLPQALRDLAETKNATPYQIALAWTIRNGGMAIPKAADTKHARENAASASINLTVEDLARLDDAFPPPRRKINLEML